ncbi:MAG TPA: single-stranded DNA-binding protein [Deltaproteobacteria bacterium]|nr:single-stranded DNA-binding protein [Deltaproteobacteria bacterium]
MLNKAMLIGRLGAAPEIRYTQSGIPVATFQIATNERWTNKDGGKEERTEWHRIVVWNQLAEICEKHLNKGKLVYIEGPIRTREYQDKEGNTKRITEVVARNMQMLDRAGDGRKEEVPPPAEDDIPF